MRIKPNQLIHSQNNRKIKIPQIEERKEAKSNEEEVPMKKMTDFRVIRADEATLNPENELVGSFEP